jgi:hypothetical protein
MVIKTLVPDLHPDPDSLVNADPDPQHWLRQIDSEGPAAKGTECLKNFVLTLRNTVTVKYGNKTTFILVGTFVAYTVLYD